MDTLAKVIGTLIGIGMGLIGLWVFAHSFLSWGLW